MRSLGRCGRRRYKKNHAETATSQSHQKSFIELQRWMKMTSRLNCTGKATYQSLQPCNFPDTGRGMRALRGFEPGDCIISIPHSLLITVNVVIDSDIGLALTSCPRTCSRCSRIQPQYLDNWLLELKCFPPFHHSERSGTVFTPQQLLTIFLAMETTKGRSSKWLPYINSLPVVYSTPLYFSSSEINLLTRRAKEVAENLRMRFCAACQEMISFLRKAFPSSQDLISEDILKWAWSTVDTRSVYLETRPHPSIDLTLEESNVALAPYLDMLNHTDTAQIAASLNPSNNCYEITTENRYNRYDQVFISYGPHDNTKLLVNYGFTLPHNLNNSYFFTLDDVKKCFPKIEHWDRKVALIRECQLQKNLVCTLEGPSWSVITSLKLLALTWDQLSLWKKLLQGISISDANNVAATQMVLTLIQDAVWMAKRHAKMVKSQPPTLHKDLILSLATDDLSILEHSLKTLKEEQT